MTSSEINTFFFKKNPTPMVVFDLDTLQLLKVNDAAVQKYGYSVEEFEKMDIKDLHSKEEVPVLLKHLQGIDKELQNLHHQHQKKCGDIFYAQVDSQNFEWGDKNVQLAVIHDVTGEVEAQMHAQKAEEEAREERKFSDLLIRSLPDAFWLMDKDGNVVDWNKQVELSSGLSSEEIREGDVFDFFAEEEREYLGKALSSAFSTGKATAEGTLVTKTGEEIPHLLTGIKFTYHDEPFVVGIGVNIKAQKEQQEKLEETNKKLDRAQKIAKIGSWEMTFHDMKLTWSDQMYELCGLTKGDFKVTFENFLALVPDEERLRLQKDLEKAIAGDLDEEIEHRIITAEGEIRHMVERGEISRDADGHPVKVSGTMQDITERKRVEEEAREERKFSSRLINNLPDIFLLVNEEGNVERWNDQFEQMTGYEKDAIKGQFAMSFFHENDRSKMQKTMSRIFQEGKGFTEGRLVTKEGEEIPHMLRGTKLIYQGKPYMVGSGININPQKERQKKLEETRRQLNRAQQLAGLGSWELNLETMKLHWSDEVYRIFGLSKEQFTPDWKGFLSYLPTEDQSKVQQALQELISGEGDEQIEHRIITSEGAPRHVVERGEVDCDADGNPIRVSGTIQDITEQKQRLQQLEKIREDLNRAQDIANVGSFEWDVVNNEIHYSDEAYRIYGIKQKKDTNPEIEQFTNIIHPDDQEFVNKQIEQILSGRGFENFEHRLLMASGEEKYVIQRGDVQHNAEGNVVKVFGTVQDITERKKVEKELHQRSKAIDASMDGISILDANNRFIYMNEANAAMYGYDSPRELVGESWEKLYSKEKIRYFDNEILPKVDKYGEWRDEDTAERKDGSVFPKEFTFSKVENGGLICICRDITERKRAEKRIEKSLQEKDVLLAEIHHRVKNNLAIISGLLELESMNYDDDQIIKKVLNQSKLRIQSMAMIHEKLYEAGDFANVELKNYVAELVHTIYKSMGGNQKNVAVDIESDEIQMNINQAIPCGMIINELVTNSFKYAFKSNVPGKLNLKLKNKEDQILLEVHDNGPGLPNDFEGMIKNSLGHRIINQLVKQLQAKIEVSSSPETGTRYKITFKKEEKSGSSSSGRLAVKV